MGTMKIKGIIISENNMGDFDKMITILTPNGKIGCSAKGSRRPKSLLMAGTQYLCFGDYVLYKGCNSYNLNSCETIEMFYNIRTDLEKLNCAVNITKIINNVTYENQNTFRILQLHLNTLYMISETEKNLDLIMSVFRLRLLAILGFAPEVQKCKICKCSEYLVGFSIKDNGVKCESCSGQDKSVIKLSQSSIDAIKHIINSPAKKIFSFDLSEECICEINLVTQIYFTEKLEM
ncbi:MAG TPA: DNA repair protein RecO [Clostridia bacterium]|nr:DNA repair protein RecO [Clostridia bacterium]